MRAEIQTDFRWRPAPGRALRRKPFRIGLSMPIIRLTSAILLLALTGCSATRPVVFPPSGYVGHKLRVTKTDGTREVGRLVAADSSSISLPVKWKAGSWGSPGALGGTQWIDSVARIEARDIAAIETSEPDQLGTALVVAGVTTVVVVVVGYVLLLSAFGND